MLIEQAKAGDRNAFQQLLEEHYTMIYRVAYHYTGQAQDAEDIAQDVCVSLVRTIHTFRAESSVSTWLYRIVVNACRDLHKKRSSHQRLQQGYTELQQHDAAIQDETARKRAWLYRSIAAMEPALKETALLVLTEELSHAEAGMVLGCAESTISWRMHEIRKQLKAALEAYHD
jgi:RNA polymerase sigma-70 factor, ECF subfamily